MLFQRSKEKQDSVLLETPRHVEEETVRRWRDMAAARDRGDNKIVVARIEDDMVQSSRSGSYSQDRYTLGSSSEYTLTGSEAASWPEEKCFDSDSLELPSSNHNYDLSESQVFEDEDESEEILGTQRFSLGELALDDEPTVHIPPIQRHQTETIRMQSQPVRTTVSDHSLSVEEDLKRRFGSNIRSALGKGTVIEGTFRFDSPVCVEGTLSGEVYSSSALIVGEGASVTGKITVGSLIVIGSVEGSVEAEELVEIRDGGSLLADIITKRIAIEDGAVFNGRCTLQD